MRERTIKYRPQGMARQILTRGTMTQDETRALYQTVEDSLAVPVSDKRIYVEVGTSRAETASGIIELLNLLKVPSVFFSFDIKSRERYWRRVVKRTEGAGFCRALFFQMLGYEGAGRVLESPWVLIDGCHCYECVCWDLNAWAPKIVPGGFLLFHDYHDAIPGRDRRSQKYHGDSGRAVEVKKAVTNQLSKKFKIVARVETLLITRRQE